MRELLALRHPRFRQPARTSPEAWPTIDEMDEQYMWHGRAPTLLDLLRAEPLETLRSDLPQDPPIGRIRRKQKSPSEFSGRQRYQVPPLETPRYQVRVDLHLEHYTPPEPIPVFMVPLGSGIVNCYRPSEWEHHSAADGTVQRGTLRMDTMLRMTLQDWISAVWAARQQNEASA